MPKAPLNNVNILTLSSKKLAPELHKALTILGSNVKSFFLYDIVLKAEGELVPYFRQIRDYEYVVVTSRNACECLYAAMGRFGIEGKELPALVVVGEKSYAECVGMGVVPEIVPERFSVDGLMERLESVALAGKSVLLLEGSKSGGSLSEYFEKRMCRVDRCVLYENRPIELSESERVSLCGFDCAYVVFTSPSSVEYYVQLCGVPSVECIAIGQKTAAVLYLYGVRRVSVPSVSTIEGVLECLLQRNALNHPREP